MPEERKISPVLIQTLSDSVALKDADPPKIPLVSIRGDFADSTEFIKQTEGSLLLGAGRLDDGSYVLLPYIHLNVTSAESGGVRQGESSDEVEGRSIFSHVLPLEQAVGLVASLAADIRLACIQMRLSTGPHSIIETKRLELSRFMASHAVDEALACVWTLSDIINRPPHESLEIDTRDNDVRPIKRKRPSTPKLRRKRTVSTNT